MIRNSLALSAVAIVLTLLVGCPSGSPESSGTPDSAPAFTAEQAKALIPAAASMSLEEFDAITDDPNPPSLENIPNHTLTAYLVMIQDVTVDNAPTFRWRLEAPVSPDPLKLARELQRSAPSGRVSMIQAEDITDCTCEVEGDRAHGTVSFKSPELYEGVVEWVAVERNGTWRIEEFGSEKMGFTLKRQDDGTWRATETDEKK